VPKTRTYKNILYLRASCGSQFKIIIIWSGILALSERLLPSIIERFLKSLLDGSRVSFLA
jgi:hypothetical protein